MNMMTSSSWLTLQLILSLIVILINICLFHLLTGGHQRYGPYFKHRWRKLGLSLAFAHVLSGSCMLTAGILTLSINHYTGPIQEMVKVETYILTLTVICAMLHNCSIMINDFKFTSRQNASAQENLFYIILIWISTSLSAFLLTFVRIHHEVTKILCAIILMADIFLFISYFEICRRTFVAFKREHEFGHEYFAARLMNDRSRHFLFLGVLLSASLITFTTPFTLERLIWQQNDVVSYICVTLNSVSQGLICIIRLYLK